MSTIAENIAAIRARIDAAARLSGRTGADITLVAATKMNDAARVREAVAAGILFNNTLYICSLFCINIQHEYKEGTIGCHLRYYTDESDK